ncbi:aldo/keto reductase [Amycolatopsis jiangsuensis]|uniref:Aryl-alcohol dehydrogenase-like predicted oxidoreductase n=1 Tax=Amycolatopsis jiangsuensis TaxID=1181879 RepID=A0A840IL93_9PSEU|nr:aldo/keto reductase [Amycolatopsis jiangsuensis]MBB4683091.1 aryl-alcohol dehydrogenase-like predicted oxidoreductase [Amycolatopsis jiangsuensis]
MTDLSELRPLGRSGLLVSPIALGAMTFGTAGLCSGDEASRAVFRDYLAAGGNFVDTANNYSDGRSEELVGEFLRELPDRDRVVLATKYSGPRVAEGGREVPDLANRSNGRKNMIASLERSLRRLRVDHVDLYWLHVWDGFTPAEEVVAAFDELVRAGKVRAVGLSDVPAWYATKAAMLGGPPITSLQLEYSLVERAIENEFVPLAGEFGIAVQPWSPLAGGFLTGKYSRTGAAEGRLAGAEHSAHRWAVLDVLRELAGENGATPAQLALHWVLRRPGVVSPIVGARSTEQLRDTLGALALDVPQDLVDRLTEGSRTELPFPYHVFERLRPFR